MDTSTAMERLHTISQAYRFMLKLNGRHAHMGQDTSSWHHYVAKIYGYIMSSIYNSTNHTCFLKIWKWKFPMKINLFIWMVRKNNILIWKNIRNRGYQDPRCCPLCSYAEETDLRLFLNCKIYFQIWSQILYYYRFPYRYLTSVKLCL